MTPASPDAPSASAPPSLWRRFPAAPLGLTAVLLALTLTPRVSEHASLRLAFLVAAALLVGWSLLLMLGPARRRGFAVDFATPQKSHYIQASVQILIYVYWGFYWDEVWKSVPLFLGQFAFLYAFDALLSWSRGRAWRLGFGPLPIVLSTNIFLWFKDDWYVLQFALIAVGALGKEFLRWKRNGRSVHIFNPSAFPLFVASLVLLTTGLTDISRARDIATTVSAPPYIYIEIFLLGLVVQYFFSVTLVTLSAIGTLVALNFAFTKITGVYLFIDVNVPVPSFIGLHFLVTDPATSPRSNAGRVLFGASYGALVFGLAGVLGHFGLPTLYDKLLPIPMLNLCVPWIDRLAASGLVARLTRWEQRLQPRRLNLACMGIWAALFTLMLTTGYIEAPHPGASIRFWKQAALEGRPMARRGLLTMLDVKKRSGDADVWNEMGLMYHDGKLIKQDDKAAVHCFAQGARLGSALASLNLVTQSIFLGAAVDMNDLLIALRHLEEDCASSTTGQSCFVLGAAWETGRGRPQDLDKAREYYKQACSRGYPEACKRLDLLDRQAQPGTPPR
jgi:Sel1 repeat